MMIFRSRYHRRKGKVVSCYRENFRIFIERAMHEEANGQTVQIGIHSSKVAMLGPGEKRERLPEILFGTKD